MLKTVKGKIAAGVLTVTLVSGGMGVAFANTNAGEQLERWYTELFSSKKVEMENDVNIYGLSLVEDLKNDKNQLITDSNLDVSEAGSTETGRVEGQITSALGTHKTDISNMANDITKWAGGKGGQANAGLIFHNLKDWRAYYEGVVDGVISQQKAKAMTEVLNAIAGQGETSITNLETAVESARSAAVLDLEAAILKAKTDIEGLLDDKAKTDGVDKLTNYIDIKVAAAKKEIEDTASDLVEEIKESILELGAELERDAIQDLQDLVDGI
ncbi:hypothetical protein H1D32_21395 [Anaerobacillus sp. CMMVII]|uniref:hypothetical protein n=1 Tax=Anaerobacillus sp. CMMVII TaxID=2755588 RepID=UPI0021B70131|nr:hypothetical protein [Anaerobacillus sp. CMMVII]MCT8140015.1 hypothetical protein [Anaerobacillus sp. CMMVII]